MKASAIFCHHFLSTPFFHPSILLVRHSISSSVSLYFFLIYWSPLCHLFCSPSVLLIMCPAHVHFFLLMSGHIFDHSTISNVFISCLIYSLHSQHAPFHVFCVAAILHYNNCKTLRRTVSLSFKDNISRGEYFCYTRKV